MHERRKPLGFLSLLQATREQPDSKGWKDDARDGSFLGSCNVWRPVRESNPCRRREREATYFNSTDLPAWIALYRTLRIHGNAYWTLNGRACPWGLHPPQSMLTRRPC